MIKCNFLKVLSLFWKRSFCVPSFRGNTYHTYINEWRVDKIFSGINSMNEWKTFWWMIHSFLLLIPENFKRLWVLIWIEVQTKIRKVSEAKVTVKYPSKKKSFANPLQNTFFWCPKTIFPFGHCFFFSPSISPFDPSLQTTRLGG